MKIYIDESPTGSGKTRRVIQSITKHNCKVLFVTERVKSFEELDAWIRAEARRQSTAPVVESVNCSIQTRLGSVSRQVEALPDRHRDTDHIIVIITHTAMLSSDLTDFQGWEIIVDEVPTFLDFGEKCTHLDAAFFHQHYYQIPIHEAWSVVLPTDDGLAITPADVRSDESHAHLSVFHQRVLESSDPNSRRAVLCNLVDWSAMQDKNVKWCWASAFSLTELASFSQVTFLGNRFRGDVGAQISETLGCVKINWELMPSLKGERQFQSRPVHIRYFSETRSASRNLFGLKEGQAVLTEIGKYLARVLGQQEHIWTANDQAPTDDFGFRSPKQALCGAGMDGTKYLSPRQAGTNAHKSVSHAAIIYSAKASPNQVALLKLMGIERSAWERSVEHEAILQFVTRTSIRDADNCSPVHLWVFDRDQALYLKTYFDGLGYVSATMSLVPDGPAIPQKEARGPKRKLYSPEEHAERVNEKRARDAARKRASRAKAKARKKAA